MAALNGEPNPRQLEFFKAKARHIAYGGARGGGKSWAMRRKFVLLALNYPGLRLLLLRRTLPELRENHVMPLLSELHGIAKYNDSEKAFSFPNGSRMVLGYCDAERDVYRYQGQEYDVVGLEEATHFTETQMQFLTTCNRSTRPDFKPRMYYTSNPGNIGHNWFKRLFVDGVYHANECADDYLFIPARVYDNTVLMGTNPEYVKTLEALPDEMRRAMLEGDWDVFAGQYFPEFRRDIHVIDPYTLPSEWKRFRSIDWGYNDPCAVYWHAVAPDKRVITYRELYINQTLASDIAKMIVDLTDPDEDVHYTVASPDAWGKRGNDYAEGESIADTFQANGVRLTKADNSRIVGWQRMREFFKAAPDGQPYWQIFSNCQNLIRTLPILLHDDHKVEDVSDKVEDHAAESCRYALMSRPRPNKEVDEPPRGNFAYGELQLMGYNDSQIRKFANTTVRLIGEKARSKAKNKLKY